MSSHALEVANLKAEISRLAAAKSAAETLATSHLERVHVGASCSLPKAVSDASSSSASSCARRRWCVCVVQTLPALTAPLTCCRVRMIRAWSGRSARFTLPPKRSMRIGGLCPVAHRSWRLVCVSQGCTNIENQPLAFVSPVLVRLFSTSRTPAPRTQTHTPQLSWTGKCVELIQSPSYTPHPLLHHMHPWLSLRSPAREPGDSYPH